jgi:hypothetical protein
LAEEQEEGVSNAAPQEVRVLEGRGAENAAPRRQPLGLNTQHTTAPTNANTGHSNPTTQHSQGHSTSRSRPSAALSQGTRPSKPPLHEAAANNNKTTPFAIFDSSTAAAPTAAAPTAASGPTTASATPATAALLMENPSWKNLGSEKARSKENTGKSTDKKDGQKITI